MTKHSGTNDCLSTNSKKFETQLEVPPGPRYISNVLPLRKEQFSSGNGGVFFASHLRANASCNPGTPHSRAALKTIFQCALPGEWRTVAIICSGSGAAGSNFQS